MTTFLVGQRVARGLPSVHLLFSPPSLTAGGPTLETVKGEAGKWSQVEEDSQSVTTGTVKLKPEC